MKGFKPYSLSEYKDNFNSDAPPKPLGGLGSCVGTEEWSNKMVRAKAALEFSAKINQENK